jgi:hypothetical protein
MRRCFQMPPGESGRLLGVQESEEAVVTTLVRGLRTAERRLAEHASELRQRAEWSQVTFEFELTEWGQFGDESSSIGFWGYVDGERNDVGGVVWALDLIRDDRGWRVERAVSVNRNTTNYQEPVADLPSVSFPGSAELALGLPELVDELLRLPAPEPTGSS